MELKECISCGRKFENVFERPIRDMIWNRINKRLGEEYLNPLYRQVCQICRLNFIAEMIETSSKELEENNSNIESNNKIIDRMKELSKKEKPEN